MCRVFNVVALDGSPAARIWSPWQPAPRVDCIAAAAPAWSRFIDGKDIWETLKHARLQPCAFLRCQESQQQPDWQRQAKRWAGRFLRLLHIRLPGRWPSLQQLRVSLRQRPPPAGAASAHGWMFHDEGDPVQVRITQTSTC